MSAERANPFANLQDVPAFTTKPRAQPVEAGKLDEIAEQHNFPSRQAKAADVKRPRRRRRARSEFTDQINIRTTPEAVEKFLRMAEVKKLPNGQLFIQAVKALERSDSE